MLFSVNKNISSFNIIELKQTESFTLIFPIFEFKHFYYCNYNDRNLDLRSKSKNPDSPATSEAVSRTQDTEHSSSFIVCGLISGDRGHRRRSSGETEFYLIPEARNGRKQLYLRNVEKIPVTKKSQAG